MTGRMQPPQPVDPAAAAPPRPPTAPPPAAASPPSGPRPPLLSATQANALLGNVLFEQVVDCIDLDALYRIEQSLIVQIGEIGVPDSQIAQVARALIDRALLRLPSVLRCYLLTADWPFGDCDCRLEDDEPCPGGGGPTPAPPPARPQPVSPASTPPTTPGPG